jgi:ATP-dependent Lon protease
LCKIIQVIKLPNNNSRVLIKVEERVVLNEIKEHKSLQKRITPLSAMVTQTAINKSPQKIKRDMKLLKNESTHISETIKSSPVVGQHVQKQPQQQTQQPTKQIMQPIAQSQPTPSVFNTMPFDMYKKITQPLPTTPLKYDPNDIAQQSSVLDNTFFPTNFKQMLSSDIGASQKKTHQRVSNKLSLNI